MDTLEQLRKQIKHSLKTRVARAREDMGYSQGDVLEELARHGLGRTQGSLSQIENGVRLPSVETLFVLARHLDTSSDYLIGLTANPLSAAGMEEEIATAKGEGKIDKLMNALPKEQRGQVLAFAEYLMAQARRDASPLTQRQRERLDAVEALDLVERQFGRDVRLQLEKFARGKGLAVEPAP